jgi:integrase/recombinase XerD
MPKIAISRPIVGSEVTLAHASEAFQLRCQAQNLSPQTCGWYANRLKVFGRFLDSKGVTLAREITPHLIRLHLDGMRARGLSSGLIARDYGAFKCFFRFLARERMIPQNPITLVEKPRMERKLVRPLSMDQVRLLLAKANQKRFNGQRIWTMAVLILDTGLRRGEVIGLKKDDIDFHRGVLRVMGKGGKEREVPFGSTSKQALWNYLIRRGDIPGQDLLFVNQFGDRICPRWMNKAFRRLGEKATIKGVRVSPHTLRHTFATQYVMNGGDAFSLQQILGHSTLEMVKVYVGLANRDVALLHQRFSPMDRMGLVPGSKRRVLVH